MTIGTVRSWWKHGYVARGVVEEGRTAWHFGKYPNSGWPVNVVMGGQCAWARWMFGFSITYRERVHNTVRTSVMIPWKLWSDHAAMVSWRNRHQGRQTSKFGVKGKFVEGTCLNEVKAARASTSMENINIMNDHHRSQNQEANFNKSELLLRLHPWVGIGHLAKLVP